MKTQLQTPMRALLAVTFVIICTGCVLFSTHSAYRSVHEYAKAGDVTRLDEELTRNPGDLNAPDDAGLTPLHLAALHCRTKVMGLLLDKGANVNQKAKGGAAPLHLAAQEGCADAVTPLLAKGADINPRDAEGRTPLGRAIQWHQDAIARLLRQRGGTD